MPREIREPIPWNSEHVKRVILNAGRLVGRLAAHPDGYDFQQKDELRRGCGQIESYVAHLLPKETFDQLNKAAREKARKLVGLTGMKRWTVLMEAVCTAALMADSGNREYVSDCLLMLCHMVRAHAIGQPIRVRIAHMKPLSYEEDMIYEFIQFVGFHFTKLEGAITADWLPKFQLILKYFETKSCYYFKEGLDREKTRKLSKEFSDKVNNNHEISIWRYYCLEALVYLNVHLINDSPEILPERLIHLLLERRLYYSVMAKFNPTTPQERIAHSRLMRSHQI